MFLTFFVGGSTGCYGTGSYVKYPRGSRMSYRHGSNVVYPSNCRVMYTSPTTCTTRRGTFNYEAGTYVCQRTVVKKRDSELYIRLSSIDFSHFKGRLSIRHICELCPRSRNEIYGHNTSVLPWWRLCELSTRY